MAAADDYASNIGRSITKTTALHIVMGLILKKLFRGQVFKGWPLYTYWHSLIQTGIIFPTFLVHYAVTVKDFQKWLTGGDKASQSSELGGAQLVQTTNIGFQVAITLLSLDKVFKDPALVAHHVITIGGCASLLHRQHCPGYGALFTACTEFGSLFHHIMSLVDTTSTRWLRVFTDIVSRPGGLMLILCEAPKARERGLPASLAFWSYFGGSAWCLINLMWTKKVLAGLLRGAQKHT